MPYSAPPLGLPPWPPDPWTPIWGGVGYMKPCCCCCWKPISAPEKSNCLQKMEKNIIVKVKLASDRPFDCSLLASAHNNHLATRIHSKCVQINIILRTLKLRLQLLPSWLPCALVRLGEPRTDPYGFAAVVGPV